MLNLSLFSRQSIKKHAFILIISSLFLLGIGWAVFRVSAVYSSPAYQYSENPANGIIEQINLTRAQFGLAGLALDTRLEEAAEQKARHLINQNYFDHYSPDGLSPWDFILASGFDYQVAGENLALNYPKDKEVIRAWMNSPTHRANLLNPRFDKAGVAVMHGDIEGQKDAVVTVLMLGKERNSRSLFELPVVSLVKNLTGI